MFWVRGAVKVFLILKSISSMRMGPWKTRGELSPKRGATRGAGRFLQKTKLPALAEKAFHRLGVHCRVTCKILADGANLLGFSLFCSGGVIKCVLGIPHWLRLFFLLPVYGVVRCRIKGTARDKRDTNSYSQVLHSSPFVLPHPGAA